ADASGTVYVETATGLHASSDEGASWTRVRGPGATLLVSPRGEAWIAGGARLVRAREAPFTEPDAAPPTAPPPPPDSPGSHTMTAFAIDGAGGLWVGIESSELSFYPTDVGKGAPIYESATIITREIRRSTDGGATWRTVSEELGASGFAFDGRGRTWVAGN